MTFSEACALLMQNPDAAEAQAFLYKEATRIGVKKIRSSHWDQYTEMMRAEAEDLVMDAVHAFLSGLIANSLSFAAGGEERYFRRMVRNRCIDEMRRNKAFGGGRFNTVADFYIDTAHADPREIDHFGMAGLASLVATFEGEARPNMAEKRSLACALFLERAQENHPPNLRQQMEERFSQMDPASRLVLYDAVRHQTHLLVAYLQERHRNHQI